MIPEDGQTGQSQTFRGPVKRFEAKGGPRIGTYNGSGLQETLVYRDPVKM